MIGTILDGKYQIIRLLGAGAMGSVFEAEHKGTGRRVAIKVINSGDITRDEQLVGRFQREAKAAGAIDTQHITQVLDTGRDRETNLPFLVMEFLSGEDVQVLLKRLGPITPDLALRIVAQACLGLQKAHEAKVVHRDIKPANLFLAHRDAGEIIIKLLDFGIAKVKMDQANEAEGNELTRTGSMLGSPLYMSPEQARGNKSIDHRADIWSLGVVLYQALTGRTPYQHITALGQLIIAICSEMPQSVQDFAPWVPPEVAAVVHRALQYDPDLRFQSAADMFAAIRQLLPYGWGIREEMLAPMQHGAPVAPRLASGSAPSIPPPAPSGQRGSSPGFSVGAPRAASSVVGATTGPLTRSQTSAGSASKLPLIFSGIMLAAAGGVAAYVVVSRPPSVDLASRPPIAAPPVSTAVEPARSAPTPALAAVTVVPVVDASLRRVKVVVLPADASVEVEGMRVQTNRGLIEITGPPGSVHRVRLFKGKNESTTDVVVTEYGASPPKVELTVVQIGKAPPGTSAAPPTPTPPQAQPGIINQFE